MTSLIPGPDEDPIAEYVEYELPDSPSQPSLRRRLIIILVTLVVILSLVCSLIAPIFLYRRWRRVPPINEVQVREVILVHADWL